LDDDLTSLGEEEDDDDSVGDADGHFHTLLLDITEALPTKDAVLARIELDVCARSVRLVSAQEPRRDAVTTQLPIRIVSVAGEAERTPAHSIASVTSDHPPSPISMQSWPPQMEQPQGNYREDLSPHTLHIA
jgi:hypothetical protein